MKLENLDDKKVFYYFEKISGIPRGSKYNTQISNYLVSFAEEHQLKYKQDEYENVTIWKAASEGYENCETVMIQGHMDMVCEKESNIKHDFTTEPLDLIVKDDFVYANGTTLGGDDGVAIAYALAILDDDTLSHPPLEVVITTDEEIGMDGAFGLDTSGLKAKYMLNIDSEEEGILLSGCAGGMTSTCILTKANELKAEGTKLNIKISGLQGGHSGAEIHKNRTNANRLLGRVLGTLEGSKIEYFIIQMNGGLKDNAIPREAEMELVTKQEEQVKNLVEKFAAIIKRELRTSEPDVTITVEVKEAGSYEVWEKELEKKVYMMLTYAPNGIQTMSAEIDGLVESSLNLGIFKTEKEKVTFSFSVRSSVASYKKYLSEQLENLIVFLGGIYEKKGEYPGWEYNPNSKLRDMMCKVYKEQYGEEIKVEAIHAGLECGIIAEKMPELDIVSLGPDIFDIHTPKEKLSISSAKRVYEYIVTVLEKMKDLS